MDKKVCIGGMITIICLIAISIVVFAGSENNLCSRLFENNLSVVTKTTDEQSLYNVIEKKDILSGLRRQELDADEIEYLMEDYAKIALLYPMTKKDVNTITDMVYEGKDLSKILDIYIFLQDSNADLKYLKPMYETAEKTDFYGQYWREDSFNSCAKQNDKVLSLSEIKQYVENGIDIEDIKIADIVSRGEKKSAKEILDHLQQGNTWGQVIDESYDVDLSALRIETDATTVLECLELSKFSDQDIGQIYSDYKQAPEQTIKTIVIPKAERAKAYVRERGLKVTDTKGYLDEMSSVVGDTLSDEEIKNFIESRYTKKEIQKAVNLSEHMNISVEEILEYHKQNNQWYEGDTTEQEEDNE